MITPHYYKDVCQKALEVRERYALTDVQTLLYNHICRGDFKLINGSGQAFYDINHNGFGYSTDGKWVKKQLNGLIREGLVKFESVRDCRGGRCTSWYFYGSDFELNDLVDAENYLAVFKLVLIKHYFKLPDGFNKRNKIYGDLEFIYKNSHYTFKYKGEENIYAWNKKGEKIDLHLFGYKSSTFNTALTYKTFEHMLYDLWSFLAHDGYNSLRVIPGYTAQRRIQEIKQ